MTRGRYLLRVAFVFSALFGVGVERLMRAVEVLPQGHAWSVSAAVLGAIVGFILFAAVVTLLGK